MLKGNVLGSKNTSPSNSNSASKAQEVEEWLNTKIVREEKETMSK